ncbi:MAG: hypothetical protein KVP17_000483, partial [Porospora cf. gigantea B]
MKFVFSAVFSVGLAKCQVGVSGEPGLCTPDCVGIDCLTLVEREVPAVLCEAGFVYDREAECCVMDVESDAHFVCANGNAPEGYMCPVESRPIYTCEKGFELVDGICVRRTKQTMNVECPAGTVMDGTSCLERIPVDSVLECSSGSFKDGDQCFTNISFRHSVVCPPNWNLEGERCAMEEFVDCTDQSLPGESCGEECYVDMQCDGKSCFHSRDAIQQRIKARKGKRFLTSTNARAAICNDQPCKVVKMTKRPDSSNLELVSKTCLKRMETDPEIFCEGPADAVFNGKECCMKAPVPPVYRCPVQQFGANDDDCFQLRRRAPMFVCAPGFNQQCRGSRKADPSRCECVEIDEAPPAPDCPERAELRDDKCVHYEEPIAYCPELGAEL